MTVRTHQTMRFLLSFPLLFFAFALHAQWTHSYPPVEGFDHQIYLEGYELPIMNPGPTDPAPSPDGSEIAFSAKGWLWLLDAESGVARRISDSGGMDSRPEWAPDGGKLAFVRDLQSHLVIAMLDLDSGEETVLVDAQAISLDPVFSADGRYVYYVSAQSGPFELWRVSPETLERERLTVSVPVRKRAVKRRPQILDADSLLIYLNKQNYYDSIELLNTKTGTHSTLIEDWVTAQSDISLSPDGRHLAYIWPNDADGRDLRLMALADPSTSVLLTRSQGLPMTPQFSYDGQWIYFVEANEDERTELRRVRVGGRAVEDIAIADWDWGVPTGRLTIRTEVDGEIAPVRISVLDESGHPLIPENGIVRSEGQNGRVLFYSSGEVQLMAPAGAVSISAVHGIETPEVTEQATIRRNRDASVTLSLARVWDPAENGWYAGDNHFHLNYGGPYRLDPEDILPELRGEAMDFAYPLLANLHNRFPEPHLIDWRYEQGPIIEFGHEVRAHFLGHVNLLGIDEPFWPWVWGPLYQVYGTDDRLNATALRFARARGGLGGYVHPVAVEDPFAEENLGSVPGAFVADAVLGEVDIIELACLWTDEVGTAALWHSVLNLGIPLSASAGSDVMNNLYRTMAIGATRVYVKLDGDPTANSYLEALKAGRSFVSNGPLLEFEAGGREPGGVIEPSGDFVDWSLEVHSALPFDSVQIFVNGAVVQAFNGNPEAGSKHYGGSVDVPEGGWITARVLGENSGWPALDSYLYAESSPVWFFDVGSTQSAAKRQAANKLLRMLDASEQSLKQGYGNAPIPRLLTHFEKARNRLHAIAAE